MARPPALLAIVAVSAGCSTSPEGAAPPSCADALALEGPTRRCDVATPTSFGQGEPVRVGVYLTTTPEAGTWTEDDAAALIVQGLEEAAEVLAPCDMRIELEAAQVIAVPPELHDIVGNEPGAWGGLAPDGEDPDAFNYALDERLADGPRALFAAAERPPMAGGAVAVFVVDRIRFYAAAEEQVVGGLSYPPVVYHHPDDHPLRNAVMLATGYGPPGSLPVRVNGVTLTHELGHMLLDTAQHIGSGDNFMQAGREVTEAQCATMRATLSAVYGEPPVADPRADL